MILIALMINKQNSDLNIKILSEMIVIEIKKKKINKLSSNK